MSDQNETPKRCFLVFIIPHPFPEHNDGATGITVLCKNVEGSEFSEFVRRIQRDGFRVNNTWIMPSAIKFVKEVEMSEMEGIPESAVIVQ